MLLDIIIPLFAVLIAELGDKTQIAIITISSKSKNYVQIFTGVILAFILIDGLAIFFAKEIADFIPFFWIKIISGLLFIFFGLSDFIIKENSKIKKKNFLIKSPFISIFLIIFFAELGDKSQIAAGIFALYYNPLLVFFGVLMALAILTIIAIFLGNIILKKINKKIIENISNWIFIILGIFTILSIYI